MQQQLMNMMMVGEEEEEGYERGWDQELALQGTATADEHGDGIG